jgi:hypothetical protein
MLVLNIATLIVSLGQNFPYYYGSLCHFVYFANGLEYLFQILSVRFEINPSS